MGRMVKCAKLGRELPGLDAPPWPGPLGQRIYESISQEAWEEWEERMKMILNEYHLLPFQKKAQDLIATHMEEFFFGADAQLPEGWTPPGSAPSKGGGAPEAAPSKGGAAPRK